MAFNFSFHARNFLSLSSSSVAHVYEASFKTYLPAGYYKKERTRSANALIMTQSNEAYSITGVTGITDVNMNSTVYEEIDDAKRSGILDEIKIGTSANSAYGVNSEGVVVSPNSAYGVNSDGVVVSPNHAYGVNMAGTEDNYYYIK